VKFTVMHELTRVKKNIVDIKFFIIISRNKPLFTNEGMEICRLRGKLKSPQWKVLRFLVFETGRAQTSPEPREEDDDDDPSSHLMCDKT
jgi:hypothetical protein